MFQTQRTDTTQRVRTPGWIDPAEIEQIGGYRLIRVLGRGACGERCLADNGPDGQRVVVHAVRRSLSNHAGGSTAGREGKRFLDLIAPVRVLEHTHILPISDAVIDRAGWHWLVTPYIGASEGLLTLDGLRRAKRDSRLSQYETRLAVRQLFSAIAAAHARGVVHGGFTAQEILVDRHGSLMFEMYGLRRRLSGDLPAVDTEEWNALVRAELRSAVEVIYEALTGASPVGRPTLASKVVRKLDRSWDRWFEIGLDERGGFSSPEEALCLFESQVLIEMKLGRGGSPDRPSDRPFRWWSSQAS
jgi:serine/threonine protein kinase